MIKMTIPAHVSHHDRLGTAPDLEQRQHVRRSSKNDSIPAEVADELTRCRGRRRGCRFLDPCRLPRSNGEICRTKTSTRNPGRLHFAARSRNRSPPPKGWVREFEVLSGIPGNCFRCARPPAIGLLRNSPRFVQPTRRKREDWVLPNGSDSSIKSWRSRSKCRTLGVCSNPFRQSAQSLFDPQPGEFRTWVTAVRPDP
jgi:hypothetical protein